MITMTSSHFAFMLIAHYGNKIKFNLYTCVLLTNKKHEQQST